MQWRQRSQEWHKKRIRAIFKTRMEWYWNGLRSPVIVLVFSPPGTERGWRRVKKAPKPAYFSLDHRISIEPAVTMRFGGSERNNGCTFTSVDSRTAQFQKRAYRLRHAVGFRLQGGDFIFNEVIQKICSWGMTGDILVTRKPLTLKRRPPSSAYYSSTFTKRN